MIKVGYCIAYDWALLRHSIPRIYEQADVICLSLDKNRRSWSGEFFSWDETGFRSLVRELDPLGKIKVYEEDFYNPELLPMQNEVAQRNKIAAFLGEGGWHIQLDADEYFLDFGNFVNYLKGFKSGRQVNICCPLINLYRLIPEGMLWIKPEKFSQVEFIQIATQYPNYEYGRRNGNFNIYTNFSILHQSWARSEEEIWEKVTNWGHAKDFDVKAYFQRWKEASMENYTTYKNFHHLHPTTWPGLKLYPQVNKIEDLFLAKENNFVMPIKQSDLLKVNSIWVSRLKKMWNLACTGKS